MALGYSDTKHPASRSLRARPAQRGAGRRTALMVFTICLSLATGLALLGVGTALNNGGARPSLSTSAAVNAQTVRDFYAAVNEAIRTGNTDVLDASVAPDVAWCHACPGRPPTRAGLKRYLDDLHRGAPDARLEVDSVVAGYEGTVTARIRPSGFPAAGEPAPWGPIDTLRLADGLIAERRGDAADLAIGEPLLRAQLDSLPPAVTGVALARLTFPVGAGVQGLLSSGPTLLVVEAGEVNLHIASGGRVVRAGGDETAAGIGMGLVTILQRGDAAIVPPGVRHALHQHGAEPAAALGATLVAVDYGRDLPPRLGPKYTPFFPPEVTGPASPPLPSVRHLAGGVVEAWPNGPVSVALGRAILGPGARVVPATDESILVAVEAGVLGVGNRAVTVATAAESTRPMEPVRELRNAGGGLLVLLVFTVAPAPTRAT